MNRRKDFLKFTVVLSLLVGVITPICHNRFFDQSEIGVTLPENWKRMSAQEKLDSLGGLLSKDAPFFLLSEIKQLTIRRQLRKMIVDKEDEVLRDGFKYSFSFRSYLGWEELSLLGLAGFAFVWMIYVSVRAIIFFIPSAPMVLFPSPPWNDRIETLNFHLWRKPARLPSIKITLFGFLSFEEGPKRPEKPGAVWID